MKNLAFRFVLAIGIVNLFADFTYEGARANAGPFLASLGASAAMVGFMSGLGELLGYGLRSVSGYLADKTHKYWAVIFIGYFVNMLAVPALALAGTALQAGALVVTERTGRAIRRPAAEAMLSHAGHSLGSGWVFGLNEALDQTGAAAGPLLTALVLHLHGSYRNAFAALLPSALLCLLTLACARIQYPRPQELEQRAPQFLHASGFPKSYWMFLAGGALIACGFADFSLMAFHFRQTSLVAPDTIPILYAIAMATAALTALIAGRWLDRIGWPVLLVVFSLPAFSAPLVFLGGSTAAIMGLILWGLGAGAQDACLKAVLAAIVPPHRRATAFGVFDTGFGIAWFAGSVAMGLLYSHSLVAVAVLSLGLQIAALPLLRLGYRPPSQDY